LKNAILGRRENVLSAASLHVKRKKTPEIESKESLFCHETINGTVFITLLHLMVPRHRLSTYGRRAFAVAGPMTFNALPDELRDPTVNTTLRRRLKTTFFRAIYTSSALEVKT